MNAGVAAIGCNIHDRMSAFVIVVDTPYAGTTSAEGRVVLHNGAGAGALTIWHQDLRAPGGKLTRAVASGRPPAGETVIVDLRPAQSGHH